MTTHQPKFCIHTVLQLVNLTAEKLLPTALQWVDIYIYIKWMLLELLEQ